MNIMVWVLVDDKIVAEKEFDIFVDACDWIRNEIGPTAENCVIVIDTRTT